jgi:multidrug efflux pump subunit AcrB
VSDYADNVVAQHLSQIDGVALVQVAGFKPAVRVEANPTALAGRTVSLEDIRSAITAATLNAPKGTLTGIRQSYTIEDNDQLFKADTYRPVIVAYRNGSPVRLSDISDVIDSVENTQASPTYDGRPCVLLVIQRQPGVNVIDTVDRIKAALPDLRGAIPPAIDLRS